MMIGVCSVFNLFSFGGWSVDLAHHVFLLSGYVPQKIRSKFMINIDNARVEAIVVVCRMLLAGCCCVLQFLVLLYICDSMIHSSSRHSSAMCVVRVFCRSLSVTAAVLLSQFVI